MTCAITGRSPSAQYCLGRSPRKRRPIPAAGTTAQTSVRSTPRRSAIDDLIVRLVAADHSEVAARPLLDSLETYLQIVDFDREQVLRASSREFSSRSTSTMARSRRTSAFRDRSARARLKCAEQNQQHDTHAPQWRYLQLMSGLACHSPRPRASCAAISGKSRPRSIRAAPVVQELARTVPLNASSPRIT